jgi:hypothetical protein
MAGSTVSQLVNHILTVYISQVEDYLSGDGPRPAAMLPTGEFEEWINSYRELTNA